MASRYRVRRNRRLRKFKKPKENWLPAGGVQWGKRILSLATMVSLLLLGFSLYRYFQHSGQMSIGEVKIMGCVNILESDLLDLARVDFRSNLLNLDLQEVSSRLARHPWVEKARVKRDFSGKALIIEVQERVPRALILLEGLYLVDRNGEIFKKAELQEKLDFPILTGLSLQGWKQKDPQAMGLIRQAMDLLDHLERGKVFHLQEVSEIHLSPKDGLTLYMLQGGVPIRFGIGGYEDKLNRLEKVLPDLRHKLKNVEYLALNYPKKVVVKMKESKQEKSGRS
jgi:cell division protein FtsQ